MKWKSTIYLEILVLANIFPVYCVIKYGWPFFSLIWLYWLESFLLIIFDVSKLLISQKNQFDFTKSQFLYYKIKKAFALFFFKFFILCFYLLFIFLFIFVQTDKSTYTKLVQTLSFNDRIFNYTLLGFLFTSYYHYIFNFILCKEYLQKTPQQLFNLLDYRTIVLHLVIILGVFASQYFGPEGNQVQPFSNNYIFLIVFIIIKTIAELVIYRLRVPKESDRSIYI